ncbi:MAG: PAS domain S-box protein [Spirochaetales bacterium]|nr:PAS domain S-box protein [Spirochaetales bacterium]
MINQKDNNEYLANTLRTIRNINRLINYEKDQTALLDGVCRHLKDSQGVKGGWIILLNKETPVEPYYHTGFGQGFQAMTDYLNAGNIPSCAQKAFEDENRNPVVNYGTCDDCPFYSQPGSITCPLYCSDNTPMGWLTVIISDERGKDKEAVRFFADLAEDIAHALKNIQTEKGLKESEERFERLFQNAPLGYQSLDEDGYFIEVNDAWVNTMGYEKREVLGRWFGDFLAPEYVEAFRERFPIFKAQGSIHSEFFMMHKNGERRYIVFEGRIGHDEQGNFRQTHCILADHTEKKKFEDALKESEAHFRSIFDNISNAILVYEPCPYEEDFILVDINPGGINLANRPGEELKGKKLTEIFPNIKKMGLLNPMLKASREGTSQYLPLAEYVDDNLSLVLESYINPLPSGRIICLMEDKTELSRMEERLRQSEKMEAIGKLAGGVAHDFNNILCGIIGYTELSQQIEELPEEALNNLEQILHAGERAKLLVNQILSFSRQKKMEKEVVNLTPQIREAVTFLKATLPATVEFSLSLDNNPPLVEADPMKIYEIIINLGTNAAAAMDYKGVIEVAFGTKKVKEQIEGISDPIPPGDYSLLTFADEGCGMTAQTISRIFEPFYTTKDVGKGTGMGLSVVFGIVKDHGGHITVSSEIERGSEFRLYFPQATNKA